MNKRERLVVSAYTGVLMCGMSDLHEFVEQSMGRPVFTHEMGDSEFHAALKDAVREEFLSLCEDGGAGFREKESKK